jgi:hypothetical protein
LKAAGLPGCQTLLEILDAKILRGQRGRTADGNRSQEQTGDGEKRFFQHALPRVGEGVKGFRTKAGTQKARSASDFLWVKSYSMRTPLVRRDDSGKEFFGHRNNPLERYWRFDLVPANSSNAN